MKFLTSVMKDLKLLFRSKESAYTVIFGPVLIILLVSFAFMGGEDYRMHVGAYAPVSTSYSERTIDTLNTKDYSVSVYPDEEACVSSVTDGTNHACISFSAQEAGSSTIPVNIYVDLSRPNIVYRIANDLSGALDIETSTIRSQLTEDALTRMHEASESIAQSQERTKAITDRLQHVEEDLRTAQLSLEQLANISIDTTQQRSLRGYQLGLAQNTRTVVNMSVEALDDAEHVLNKIEHDCKNCSPEIADQVDELKDSMEDARVRMQLIAQDTAEKQLFEANSLLDSMIEDLEALKVKIQEDEAARFTIRNSVMTAAASSETNRKEIAQVSAGLSYAQGVLASQTINASTISTPVQTSFVNVATTHDQLSVTYPYLLVLVIMFIGMLLSSILVVTDKTSRARFRNFTTPTSDNYHVAVSFATAALLLIIEVAVILVLSRIFVAQPLHLFSPSTLIIMLLAIVSFTFLGMVIGNLVNTQEAAMIASISIGSILLFVSNLIIPIEGMARLVQKLTAINPYVVLSELLKKSMFYGVSIPQISRQILLLGLLCVALLGLTLLIQRRNKRKYFKQDAGLLAAHVPAPLELAGRQVNTEVDLLDALDHMTRQEFEAAVKSDDNIISAWVKNELRNGSLARKLRTTSKERMILRLDKHLEKHGKHLRR